MTVEIIRSWEELENVIGKKLSGKEKKEYIRKLVVELLREVMKEVPCGLTPSEVDYVIDNELEMKVVTTRKKNEI